MARKKTVTYREQLYDVGEGVTVLVRYPEGKRPRMFHNDTQVVVGEGIPISGTTVPVSGTVGLQAASPTERPSQWTPELDAKFKAAQEEGRRRRESAAEIAANGAGAEGALTAEDMKQFTDGLEFAALAAVGT